MKVLEFQYKDIRYVFFAKSEELAIEEFKQNIFEGGCTYREIPQSEWDKETVDVYEDNQFDSKPRKVSISDLICGEEPQMIYTNDSSIIIKYYEKINKK